jgi:DNA-binding NarL/FixJ family response regulator
VLGRGTQAAVIAAAAAAPPPAALAALDSRDLEILELLAQGLPTGQVAARLFLAPKTIRNRVSDMLAKLGVATREEAIALGRAGGLGRAKA